MADSSQDFKNASASLKKLLVGDDPAKWPVLHVPLHANTFPLAYVYAKVLKEEIDGFPPSAKNLDLTGILELKIKTEDWGDNLPDFDRKARFNVFFANAEQVKRWRARETFAAFHIFNYEHKFFLSDPGSKIPSNPPIKQWAKSLDGTLKEIRIVTDIKPEAERLRNDIVSVLVDANKATPYYSLPEKITIALSSERTPHDVLQWMLKEKDDKTILRMFFFGTPVCEILKSESTKYLHIEYIAAPVRTYLCIQASDPNEAWLPLLPIYHFFKFLGYQETTNSNNSLAIDITGIADAFRRSMETRLPGVSNEKFGELFETSIIDHCSMVSMDDFVRPYSP